MRESKTVTVYSFLVRNFLPDCTTYSTFKACRELIVNKFKGEVLEGTGEEVSIEQLDSEGRHRRIATGWGELP